jgi:hypothetical protein
MKAVFSVVGLLVPAVGYAQPAEQPSGSFDHHVGAPSNAIELSVGVGYSQGGGKLGGNMPDLDDVAGPGGALELDLGYRFTPSFSLGAYGTLGLYDRGDSVASDTNIIGASAGIQAAWHFRPDRSVDPWVRLGTGWKGIWLDPDEGKATSLQGLELARLQVGVDYRVSEDIAISPVIGASLSTFISEDSPMTTEYTEIDDKDVAITGFAGIAGRFDFGGTR